MLALKGLVPWLTVLALIFVLDALRLKALATLLAVGWLAYCAYTWIRAGRRRSR